MRDTPSHISHRWSALSLGVHGCIIPVHRRPTPTCTSGKYCNRHLGSSKAPLSPPSPTAISLYLSCKGGWAVPPHIHVSGCATNAAVSASLLIEQWRAIVFTVHGSIKVCNPHIEFIGAFLFTTIGRCYTRLNSNTSMQTITRYKQNTRSDHASDLLNSKKRWAFSESDTTLQNWNAPCF